MTNDAKDLVLALVSAHLAVGSRAGSTTKSDIVSRQITMYLLHVVLQYSMTDIARMFGKDRTTVGNACANIEDRRDDAGFDTKLDEIERQIAQENLRGSDGQAYTDASPDRSPAATPWPCAG